MKSFLLFLALAGAAANVYAQTIYSKTYGSKGHPPVIFIHGGPGGNAVQFEATTAQRLADSGFYVIVYDRRGEGRSTDEKATFTYQEAIEDLQHIYRQYHLKKACIIGHSFGGLVSTLFTEKYPQKVQALVLAGALFAQQATYDHILDSVSKICKEDTACLAKIATVAQLDHHSAAYRAGCFDIAGEHGFFKLSHPDAEARDIYHAYKTGSLYQSNFRNRQAPLCFYQNEKRTNIDVRPVLKQLTQKLDIFAVYGRQDAIFSPAMLATVEQITGREHFLYLDNCSHYLYADQQTPFLSAITKWLRAEKMSHLYY
ncbi:alpha/beta fold hydrolase [Chitinophaga vietnamensis]|uniref:alpha/beta fold hydrolase n=1 Tax=Chitinophaga vietnamensis TaxID=2593957 RepID=UPI0011782E0B|nr:alpha/beta hydrolase [Chitinophaga vietnamensis]